jgi:ribosome-binding factor A
MASNRIGRINEEIQRELAELIRSLKDPRTQTMISITHVDTTPDLRYAKVFVSVLEDARSKEALKGLKSAAGWLRRELGSRLQLRYTPELVFQLDDSLKYGAHMFDLLSRLSAEEHRAPAEDSASEEEDTPRDDS